MKLLNLASSRSFWRGVDYYHDHYVKTWKQCSENEYEGEV